MTKHNWIVNASENAFFFDYQLYESFIYADLIVLNDPHEAVSIQIEGTWYIYSLPEDVRGQVSAVLLKASLLLLKKIEPKKKS